LETITLRLRVKYIPDGGNDVKHPSLGYRFLGDDAARMIKKYRLDDGAGFEEISSFLSNEDFRNHGLASEHADFVDVIISSRTNPDFKQVAKRYDFSSREVSNLIA
jgi:hypothetical protein